MPSLKKGYKTLFALEADYDIKDCSKNEEHPSDSYFACLKKSVLQRCTKCDYCHGYTDTAGCRCHGYRCSKCGKVTYREYVHAAPIRLYFLEEQGAKYLNFRIHSYDKEKQRLLVYAKPQKSGRWGSLSIEKVPEYLSKFKDSFVRLEKNGKKLLAFDLPEARISRRNCKIGIADVGSAPYQKIKNPKSKWGYDLVQKEEDRRCCYRMVQLYKGKEYEGEMGFNLPVKDMVMIYPTYKCAPLKRDDRLSHTLLLKSGLVPDCGYYYQDGSKAIYEGNHRNLELFVEHFTDLNLDKFKQFLRISKNDGPGFICQLAQYITAETGIKQYVENLPNIGNVIVGFSKVMSGQGVTKDEMHAMSYGFSNCKTRSDFEDLLASFKEE